LVLKKLPSDGKTAFQMGKSDLRMEKNWLSGGKKYFQSQGMGGHGGTIGPPAENLAPAQRALP